MKWLEEPAASLMSGAGLLIFMGGMIGGLLVLGYQLVHFLRQGEWLVIPVASALETVGVASVSMHDTATSGGLVGWALDQPVAVVAIMIAILIGWPLIVLSDRVLTGRKKTTRR
jgi:hypothetical protein